jgi:hypothetical protein
VAVGQLLDRQGEINGVIGDDFRLEIVPAERGMRDEWLEQRNQEGAPADLWSYSAVSAACEDRVTRVTR